MLFFVALIRSTRQHPWSTLDPCILILRSVSSYSWESSWVARFSTPGLAKGQDKHIFSCLVNLCR